MTDAEILDYLQENGYPPHLAREGRAGSPGSSAGDAQHW